VLRLPVALPRVGVVPVDAPVLWRVLEVPVVVPPVWRGLEVLPELPVRTPLEPLADEEDCVWLPPVVTLPPLPVRPCADAGVICGWSTPGVQGPTGCGAVLPGVRM